VGTLANDNGKYNWLISDVTPQVPLCNSLTGSEGFLAIEVIMAKYGLVEAMTK